MGNDEQLGVRRIRRTYKMMGVDFDKIYYESQTYLEGKGKVLEGLDKGIFYRREDGSVWADLTKDGLDENCCSVPTELPST